MKNTSLVKVVGNEDGFVLAAAMLVLLVLVILGIAATNISNTEYMIAANDRMTKVDFYNQEGCLAHARFNINTWYTDAFASAAETAAYFPQVGLDVDGNGIIDTVDSNCSDPNGLVVASYKVRKVESTGTPILGGWVDNSLDPVVAANHPANQFPLMTHTDKPMPGSHDDPSSTRIFRFVVTSSLAGADRKVILQEGVYKNGPKE